MKWLGKLRATAFEERRAQSHPRSALPRQLWLRAAREDGCKSTSASTRTLRDRHTRHAAAGGTPSPKETGSRWPCSQQPTEHLCSPPDMGSGPGPLCEDGPHRSGPSTQAGSTRWVLPLLTCPQRRHPTAQSEGLRGHRVTVQPTQTDSRLREAEPLEPVLLFVP